MHALELLLPAVLLGVSFSVLPANTIHVPSQQPTIQAGIPDGFVKSELRGGINAGPYQRWVARYNGPGNLDDRAYSIALDADDNVYVTGYSYGSDGSGTESDFATIKYGQNPPHHLTPVWW